MSTITRDIIEEHKHIAKHIQKFMWEDKPFKSKKKKHTIVELEEFLENLRKRCWENYDDGAKYMGWK